MVQAPLTSSKPEKREIIRLRERYRSANMNGPEPVWNWNEDKSEATVTFTCKINEAHTESIEAQITSKTTDATCGADGKTVYTAKAIFGGEEYTDTEEVVIPATGKHTYKDGTM